MTDTSTPFPGSSIPERTTLSEGFEISRIVTGLWQVADMEKSGTDLEADVAARAMLDYVTDGFDTFDMADHYGSSELIANYATKLIQQEHSLGKQVIPRIFTKWCPKPVEMTTCVIAAGIQERLDRLGSSSIDLLQFHWWHYENPNYLDALRELERFRQDGVIANLGLTNFNSDHLKVVLGEGVNIVTNQVSYSLLDRRAAESMSDLCIDSNVQILAYGTLCGGFLSDRWLGVTEPESGAIADWSKMKYRRFIKAFGGWEKFQMLLTSLSEIATKHGVSVANIATRWVLEQPAVAAVIVGARLGESEHRADNLRLFSFSLDEDDYEVINSALQKSDKLPGDCGDEYRKAPYLTASGDLSHHLTAGEKNYPRSLMDNRPSRSCISSHTSWEEIGGFSRAVREGDHIFVSGTTATDHKGKRVCEGRIEEQAIFILDKIIGAIQALGGTAKDIVRTRIYLTNEEHWETVTRVHGRYFFDQKPANTLIVVAKLIGGYEVEIEAEAVVAPLIGD
ncbi:MAG: aldo/keto reductase [Gammaproteobacteria bacterium]|nr:aldo/keto reductase [Gammaproteobacteria bacterium]